VAPEVEHGDAVAHRHHEVHVMLDQQHRHVAPQAADALAQLAHVLAAEPAGRLVEQDQLRSPDERARQRDALLDREGQRSRQPAGDVVDAERLERLERRRAQGPLVAIGARQSQQRRGQARAAPALRPGHDVLERRQPREQPDALERAGDPEARELMRPDVAQRALAPRDVAVVGAHEAADHVEERRLARAVGADDADDLARRDLQGDVVERGQAAEAHRDRVDAQPVSLSALVGGHGIPVVPRGRDLHAQRHGATVWVGGPPLIVAATQTSQPGVVALPQLPQQHAQHRLGAPGVGLLAGDDVEVHVGLDEAHARSRSREPTQR
jgi:hypothetical protein